MKELIRYSDLINIFNGKRILVIGDFLLDVYLRGSSTRLCPEAPVPVVDVHERKAFAGGAANAVCNLRVLGAGVSFCSVIGTDAEGDEALELLDRLGASTAGVVRDAARQTITKTRVVAGSQVITRIDRGTTTAINPQEEKELIARIEKEYAHSDGVIFSDYDKGVITPAVIESLSQLRKKEAKFLAVDSKRLPVFAALQPSLVKPNYDEAIRILGIERRASDRLSQIVAHSDDLFRSLRAPVVAVTLDAEGSLVIQDGKPSIRLAAPAVSTPHVSGAGDTYLSAFALSSLSGADIRTSAEVATAAAAIAIGKESTSTCTQAELKNYFNIQTKYVSDVEELEAICAGYRQAGKRIVFTNGCFDILHSGHVTYLHRARALGDVLIVGVNTDESIRRIKGEERPINGLPDRLNVLAGLSSVDHIIPFGDEDDDTPVPLIRAAQPHVFAKGGDYTKDKLPEADTVMAYGGEIVLLEHIPDRSTTRIINRIQHTAKKGMNIYSQQPS